MGNPKKYIDDVKQWFLEVQNQYAGIRNEDLQSQISSFSTYLESQNEKDMTSADLFELQERVKSLYEVGLRLADEYEEYEENGENRRVGVGQHKLPPLPYDYDALEPYISKEIMRLHHDKHHKSYVDGLNKAEKMMEKARNTGDYDLLKHWEREAAFHGSGHYLRSEERRVGEESMSRWAWRCAR